MQDVDVVAVTPHKAKMIARDNALYDEYHELMRKPGAMATAVTDYLVKKYEFCARSTVWSIIKKVAAQREAGKNG